MARRSKLLELAQLETALDKAAGSLAELRALTSAETGASSAGASLASSAELGEGIETLVRLIEKAKVSVEAEIGLLLEGGS
jgi:hypothetical protein